jgi:hypothetical protein
MPEEKTSMQILHDQMRREEKSGKMEAALCDLLPKIEAAEAQFFNHEFPDFSGMRDLVRAALS